MKITDRSTRIFKVFTKENENNYVKVRANSAKRAALYGFEKLVKEKEIVEPKEFEKQAKENPTTFHVIDINKDKTTHTYNGFAWKEPTKTPHKEKHEIPEEITVTSIERK